MRITIAHDNPHLIPYGPATSLKVSEYTFEQSALYVLQDGLQEPTSCDSINQSLRDYFNKLALNIGIGSGLFVLFISLRRVRSNY